METWRWLALGAGGVLLTWLACIAALALVALVLRSLARSDGGALVREHWPGPPSSLALVLRLAGVGARP